MIFKIAEAMEVNIVFDGKLLYFYLSHEFIIGKHV